MIGVIVTVIVLLILSGISINAIMGNNSVIANAQTASYEYAEAEKEEKLKSSLAEASAIRISENETREASWKKATSYPDLLIEVNNPTWNNVYIILDGVPIPIGFEYVEGTKNLGLVIKDTVRKNEFVWIPVDNIDEMYDSSTMQGKLYDYNTNTKKFELLPVGPEEYREPDLTRTFDNDSSYISQTGFSGSTSDFHNRLKLEFADMISSVQKYGGFYLGRYETGNLNTDTVVSQQYNTKISGINWYSLYKKQKDLYLDSTIVTSGTMWGCQWDTMAKWIYTSLNKLTSNKSTSKASVGNFNGTHLLATGSTKNYKINNLYDIAGNVTEWTMEAFHQNARIARGGAFNSSNEYSSKDFSISFGRWDIMPVNSSNSSGGRLQVYINP